MLAPRHVIAPSLYSETTGRHTMSDNTLSNSDHAATARAKLGEAGSHLKTAANLASVSARHAAEAAASELKVGGEAVKDELGSAGKASKEAAHEAGEVAREQVDAAISKGRAFLSSGEALIRERPLAAFGIAFAAGFLLSRIARR